MHVGTVRSHKPLAGDVMLPEMVDDGSTESWTRSLKVPRAVKVMVADPATPGVVSIWLGLMAMVKSETLANVAFWTTSLLGVMVPLVIVTHVDATLVPEQPVLKLTGVPVLLA